MDKDQLILILRRFKNQNHRKYGITNIGIFGSSVRYAMTEQSDVDIVVELKKPDMFNLIGIKQDLEEQLQRSIDIIRYREKMNPFLKRKIEKEALYV